MTGAETELTPKLPAPARLTCPDCGTELLLYTHAQARTVACKNCSHLFAIRDSQLVRVADLSKEKREFLIPLGAKGRFNDTLYQVTGFLFYEEAGSKTCWQEYLLFNPVAGYAFLSEYNGHWNFFRFASDVSHPGTHTRSLMHAGKKFDLFHKYQANVKYAAGEFFWNIREGSPQYTEYTAPPLMLTRIRTAKELSWLLGEYQEPQTIKSAFGLEQPMPQQNGTGANEPLSGGFAFEKIKSYSVWAACLLVLLQVLLVIFCQNKTVARAEFNVSPLTSVSDPKPIVGPTFTLNSAFSGTSNIEFRLNSPVNNDWFATGVTLLNTRTGQEYDFEIGVEYYHGTDGGESWSEGGPSEDVVLSALPDGEYQMFIRPYRSFAATNSSFAIVVLHDVAIWSNFWIILLLLIIFPVLQFLYERNFEKNRWMNSDYSPYEY